MGDPVSLSSIVGKGYDEFWTTRKFYRVVKGSKGSKKSKTCALWYVYHMMKYPDANLLCIRRYKSNLRDSCYTDILWAAERLGVAHLWKGTISPLRITYVPTGQSVLFIGLDDPQKVASIGVTKGYLCWVWFEEFSQIQNETDFDKIDFSIRGYIPPETGLFKQITCTFNPWSEHTWIKPRFFDNPDKSRIFATTTTYRVNEYLDEADIARYDEIRERSPRLARIICDGDWGVSEGLIYENWSVDDFDIDEVMRKHPDARTSFGLDFGYKISFNAFVAVLIDVKEHELWIYDEYYSKGVSNIEIAKQITKMGYSKEEIYADAAEPKSISELRNGLLEDDVVDGNTVINRWQLPRIMPALKGPDSIRYGISTLQSFKMHVHPKCENMAMELSVYCYDTNAEGQFIDRPLKENDHLCLIGSTIVMTSRGPMPIKDIRAGIKVLGSDKRFHVVSAWAKTSDCAPTCTLWTGTVSLTGTHDHKVPIRRKTLFGRYRYMVVPMKDIRRGDMVYFIKDYILTMGSTKDFSCRFECREVTALDDHSSSVPVYSITVEDTHDFFANGILVKNCDALRYATAKFFMRGKGRVVEAKGEDRPAGEKKQRSKRVFSA